MESRTSSELSEPLAAETQSSYATNTSANNTGTASDKASGLLTLLQNLDTHRVDAYEGELHEMKQLIEKYQNTVIASEKENSDLKSQIETMKDNAAIMHMQLAERHGKEDALKAEVADLRSKHIVFNANADAMRSQLDKCSGNENKLKDEITTLRNENAASNYVNNLRKKREVDLCKKLEESNEMRQKLEKDVTNLRTQETLQQQKLAKLSVQLSECNKKIGYLEAEITRLRSQDLVSVHKNNADRLLKQLNDARLQRQNFEAKVIELTRSLQLREPLVEIGAAIRMRCLEQAKCNVVGFNQHLRNHSFIKAGNAAAHNANGRADAAIFECHLAGNKANMQIFEAIFLGIYDHTPEVWATLPAKLKDALDCRATVMCVEVVSRNRALGERQLVFDHVDVIRQKYRNMTLTAFETDEDVARRLRAARVLAEEIVEADRDRRGGSEGVTRRSEY